MKRRHLLTGRMICGMALAGTLGLAACGQQSVQTAVPEVVTEPTTAEDAGEISNNTAEEEEEMDYAKLFGGLELAKSYKGVQNNNPIIEQHYGADPFAMVYEDTVYFYMTADAYEYNAAKEIKENSYSKIASIYVVSTKDMINFTDHGEIKVAGKDGVATWAKNSWAPAAAWKMIDGKPKFFLYFADNGGGIGVVCADSPVGPFRDDPQGYGKLRQCGMAL